MSRIVKDIPRLVRVDYVLGMALFDDGTSLVLPPWGNIVSHISYPLHRIVWHIIYAERRFGSIQVGDSKFHVEWMIHDMEATRDAFDVMVDSGTGEAHRNRALR